jgi:hypothetical protein
VTINIPTGVTESTATIIDQIITYLLNAIILVLDQNLLHPQTSNNIILASPKDSLVLLEMTGTDLIKVIQGMKNKKSGLDDLTISAKKCTPHIIKLLVENKMQLCAIRLIKSI